MPSQQRRSVALDIEHGSLVVQPGFECTITVLEGKISLVRCRECWRFIQNSATVADKGKCVVQGKTASTGAQASGSGAPRPPRPSQASTLTHHFDICLEPCFYSHACCSIGVWCVLFSVRCEFRWQNGMVGDGCLKDKTQGDDTAGGKILDLHT